MGIYVEVEFHCPSCRRALTIQPGGCDEHATYPSDKVPRKYAEDILGRRISCVYCELDWRIVHLPPEPDVVCLGLAG